MSYPGSGDPSQRAYGQYGAQPNPSDRVIPPPGYSPDTADSGASDSPSPSGRPLRPPRAAVQPNVAAQPRAAVQPNVAAQPRAAVQPNVAAQPRAAVQPDVAAQPRAAVQPNVAAQPRAAVQPDVAAQSGGPGAVPFPPVFAGGPPQSPRNGNGGLWIVVAVLVAVALILGGVFAWLTLRDDASTAVASASAAPPSVESDGSASGAVPGSSSTGGQESAMTTLPAGAQTCPATVASTGGLRGSAVGSTATSCPFAEEVRLAYTRGGSDRNSRTVVASSPVTGKRYEMNCVSSAQLVTCTGGENAVVYLF
ncbi:hypothetical protein CH286_16120 [Rhodococcus sp. WWJCD1]|uniref:hypothetical protein n=1 Tax=Rhodococcus sp. WWJCD1 TaxID=2022519 RepID=UPI000B9A1A64|nr:hypothetical protein [Rhodococcus sp. WWJCD1]OZC46592.1 hypothetical protein CH286_16120 [Rhodococcus sp. WWJCD1]